MQDLLGQMDQVVARIGAAQRQLLELVAGLPEPEAR